MKKHYKELIHRVLADGKEMHSRQIFHAIIDLPAVDDRNLKKRRTIPEFSVLVGMLANPKYGCVRVNRTNEYPAIWKLKEE